MKCEICESEEHELVSENLRYTTNQKIYRCKRCGLVFLHPKMTPAKEKKFYEEEYGEIYSNEKGTTPADLFQARLQDAEMYKGWIKSYLSGEDDCLEIGCASGYFLETIKNEVRSVSGIETHLLLKQYCEKLGISMFEELDDVEDDSFDKIFLFFVLEHLGEPKKYLESLLAKLKPNGKIFIVVPNVDDALLSLYDLPAFKSFYYTPAHQFYYSKKTLANLFRKTGIENFEIKPIQRYDLSNHMYWMIYSKPGGMGRYNNVFHEKLNLEYKTALESKFICDTLFAVITKN